GRVNLLEAGSVPPARPSADLLIVTLATTGGPGSSQVSRVGTLSEAAAGFVTIFTVCGRPDARFGKPVCCVGWRDSRACSGRVICRAFTLVLCVVVWRWFGSVVASTMA